MSKNYPEYFRQLQKSQKKLIKEIAGPMTGYGLLHKESVAEGVLDTKTKELIALGIGITVRCDGCVSYHVHDALRAGATRKEILETVSVAIMMGGGPAMVYGCEALEALDQFEKEAEKSNPITK